MNYDPQIDGGNTDKSAAKLERKMRLQEEERAFNDMLKRAQEVIREYYQTNYFDIDANQKPTVNGRPIDMSGNKDNGSMLMEIVEPVAEYVRVSWWKDSENVEIAFFRTFKEINIPRRYLHVDP